MITTHYSNGAKENGRDMRRTLGTLLFKSQPRLKRWGRTVLERLEKKAEQKRQREAFLNMPEYMFRDIGYTRQDFSTGYPSAEDRRLSL